MSKSLCAPIDVSHSQYKILHIKHHACLKNVFQKLIVFCGSSCFHLYYYSSIIAQSVSAEILVNLIVISKQDGHIYFLFFVCSFLLKNLLFRDKA